jgi:hypothetical protein
MNAYNINISTVIPSLPGPGKNEQIPLTFDVQFLYNPITIEPYPQFYRLSQYVMTLAP